MNTIRRAAVAGSFYEGHPLSLKTQLEECFLHRLGPGKMPKKNTAGERKILGFVSPHAGYMYSGPVAAWNFYELSQDGQPKSFIIIGPSHRGSVHSISIMTDGLWQTPLGFAKIDTSLAKEILGKNDLIKLDKSGYQSEHSIEVQIPFLQFLYGDNFHFVPICLSNQEKDIAISLGETLSDVIKDKDCVLITSSDFSHYEPQKTVEKKDKIAIDSILKLDIDGLYKNMRDYNISMCGYGPIATLMTVAKKFSANNIELLKYATSGDITHSYNQVVAYSAIKFSR